jgi:peptidoglycan/LPS O-acetylase OafA/YrhL
MARALQQTNMGPAATKHKVTTVEKGGATQRIPEFDFTKGVLVLFMVLYHWLNYFVGTEGDFYRYLRFLTPSFIFITGFLISHLSASKYSSARSQLTRRLALRGLKILAVFVGLNVGMAVLFPGSPLRGAIFTPAALPSLKAIFITGNFLPGGLGKAASFTILVPIGYLLIASSGLLSLSRVLSYPFHLACGISLACTVLLDRVGLHTTNLELIAIGLLGVVAGYTPSAKIAQLGRRLYAIILAYCAYLAAITLWDVPFGLRIAGVCLTLALIYAVAARLSEPRRRRLVVLGRYSLLGYISQIAILQLLHRIASYISAGIWILPASLLAGLVLTMASVAVVDRARPRSATIDRFYRAVFA